MWIICVKMAQRIHFLQRLRLFGLGTEIMFTLYSVVLGSIMRYNMASWHDTLTVQLTMKIKLLIKVIGMKEHLSLQNASDKTILRDAHRILINLTHILYNEYELLLSCRCYKTGRCKSNHFKLSFL